jgi:hypothetical protein
MGLNLLFHKITSSKIIPENGFSLIHYFYKLYKNLMNTSFSWAVTSDQWQAISLGMPSSHLLKYLGSLDVPLANINRSAI